MGGSLAAAIVDYYLSPKPPELRCPMVAHGEDVGRIEEDCALRGVYGDGAQALYETFMDAAKGSMAEDQAKLVFAAMIGVNLLSGRGRRRLGCRLAEIRQGRRRCRRVEQRAGCLSAFDVTGNGMMTATAGLRQSRQGLPSGAALLLRTVCHQRL